MGHLQDLQKAMAGISRIQTLFYTQSQIVAPSSANPPTLPSKSIEVAFQDVSFHYAVGTPVLHQVSFRVKIWSHF